MTHIVSQIAGEELPTDKGLLERIEADRNPSPFAMLALISRCADVLERDDYTNERLEEDHYVAFTALDVLRGKLSECLHEDETGLTAQKRREDAIRAYHDERRYD